MELKRYFTLLTSWAWLIVLSVLLAGGAAYLVSSNSQPVYRASARMLIDQAPGSGGGNEYSQILLEQRLATTYVELIRLTPVLEETILELDLPYGPDTLSSRLTVSAPRDTQILVVTAEDSNPERAAAIANTLAEVFIKQNQERQQARFVESIDTWETRMEENRAKIDDLREQILALGEPENAEEEILQSQLQTSLREAEARYTEDFNNLEELRVEEAKSTNNLILVEPARVPRGPVSPRPLLNTVLGAMVGGMLALGFVFLVDYLDDSIRTPEQVEEAIGLSPVGAIAHIKADAPEERLIAHLNPRAPISEAYRVLRTNLSFAAIDEGLHTMLVTSASPGEGKSTTAANLATVMAQNGDKVFLIDADLRRPTQHTIFNLPNNHGLTTALLDGETAPTDHFQETRVPNLYLMSSGPIPPNPAELLNSKRMLQLVEKLKAEADVVIFDAPPALTVADPSILAPAMGGCLLVAQVGQTRLQALAQATEALQKANAHLLGFVLNQVRRTRAGYYQYYHYRYSEEEDEQRGLRRWLPQWLPGLSKR